jgi:hypothetical protein
MEETKMKYKTTAKAIRQAGGKIISIGYCDAYHLLSNHQPVAYTSGVYGWNFDVYEVNGITICTGYRGMPGKTPNNLDEYERKARAIYEDYTTPYEERKTKIEQLLNEFLTQA